MGQKNDIDVIRAHDPIESPTPWKLTEFDLANRLLILRGTWIFDKPLDPDLLKSGLARLLNHYPHLAGRMVKGKEIVLNNAGVPFTIASNTSLGIADVESRSLDNSFIGSFSGELSKSRISRGREAPIKVKLTELGDGCVLGVRCTHACLDGDGFYSMVSNWSRLCRGAPITPPILDQSLIPKTTSRSQSEVLREASLLGWKKLSLLDVARTLPAYISGRLNIRAPALHFSEATLGKLKADIGEAIGCEELSTNVALSAHLTRMSARLHGLSAETPCSQVTIVNWRRRVPSIPAAFVGNAAFPIVAEGFTAGSSLNELAELIHQKLAPFLEPDSKVLEREIALQLDLIRHRKLMSPFDFFTMHSRRPTTAYINNFSKLPIYDVDFGDEATPVKPVRVIPHDLPDPFLIWPAPPEVGGVEVYLTGVAARSAMSLDASDSWWDEITSAA
jgi:hypothetical protein